MKKTARTKFYEHTRNFCRLSQGKDGEGMILEKLTTEDLIFNVPRTETSTEGKTSFRNVLLMLRLVTFIKETTIKYRKVVPIWQLEELLSQVHIKANHQKRDAMLALLSDYTWPKKRQTIQQFCDNCIDCMLVEPRIHSKVVKSPIIPEYVNHHWQLDAVSLSADEYGMTGFYNIIDLYSKKCATIGSTAHVRS